MNKICKYFLAISLLLKVNCSHEQRDSGIKAFSLVKGSDLTIIYSDNLFVRVKQCTPLTRNLGRKCQAVSEEQLISHPQFFLTLQELLGQPVITDLKPFLGIHAFENIKSEITRVSEALKPTDIDPSEKERLSKQLFVLKKILSYVERAKDLYYEVLSEDLKEIGSGGTNFDFLIQAADKAKRSWVDEKQSLIWQHLNESMIWFDANDVPRVREAGGDQSQTVQTGCKSTLGNSWRVPSLEEVKNAFSGGFKLSTTYKNNSVSKVWSSSISDNGSGVVFGIAYEVKFKLPAEESRWSTASVLCVKNLN